MFKRILVATDGSALSQRAVDTAVGLARSLGATLVGVTAVDAYPYVGIGQTEPSAYNEFQARAAADAGCDAIVMASHGRRGVSALLLGSETQHVLSQSSLPVIVVR